LKLKSKNQTVEQWNKTKMRNITICCGKQKYTDHGTKDACKKSNKASAKKQIESEREIKLKHVGN
jgi:hypothetical protein